MTTETTNTTEAEGLTEGGTSRKGGSPTSSQTTNDAEYRRGIIAAYQAVLGWMKTNPFDDLRNKIKEQIKVEKDILRKL